MQFVAQIGKLAAFDSVRMDLSMGDGRNHEPAGGARNRMRPTKPPSSMATPTTPPYSIGLARAEHLPALSAIELAAAALLTGYAPASVLTDTTGQQTFADAVRDGRLWVALMKEVPIGFALVKMLADDLPHLEELDVDPRYGRRGVGRALVRAVCEWAAVSGYAMLTLTTFRAVPWNFPFYARLGFVEIPRDTLRPELSAVVSEEAYRGLDPDTRAVMGYRCVTPAIRE